MKRFGEFRRTASSFSFQHVEIWDVGLGLKFKGQMVAR